MPHRHGDVRNDVSAYKCCTSAFRAMELAREEVRRRAPGAAEEAAAAGGGASAVPFLQAHTRTGIRRAHVLIELLHRS
jgi:hypothetical protein